MKTTDFAHWISRYFTTGLAEEQGASPLTVDSYRYTFIQFLDFMEQVKGIPSGEVAVADLTREAVVGFLSHLEEKRGICPVTRNQRLAAIKGFVHYLNGEYPDYLEQYQLILGIPAKKTERKAISFIGKEGAKLLLSQVDLRSPNGLRDYVMLLLLYSVGLRVSELIGIRVCDVNTLGSPPSIVVMGKGRKARRVPLFKEVLPYVRKYLDSMGYSATKGSELVFKNHMQVGFTRQGINYLIKKYADMARKENPQLIPDDLSPHKLRHSAAMGMLESGLQLIYIRDLLGHVSVTTTERYAKANEKFKREALEKAAESLLPNVKPIWKKDKNVKEWLKSFGKR
ncbi:MAG: site-specific integrase [Burkholderiales bacterium]|nr:site-specific integrase [Burkholderiales bacterium]